MYACIWIESNGICIIRNAWMIGIGRFQEVESN